MSEEGGLSDERITEIIESGMYSDDLFYRNTLNQKHVAAAIDRGKSLKSLYRHCDMSPANIHRAISKGKELGTLYCRKLDSESIDRALRKGKELPMVFGRQVLSDKQKGYVIENGDPDTIVNLVVTTVLLPEQIDILMKTPDSDLLNALYGEQKLSPKQVNVAIERGDQLGVLFEHQKMSSRHIDRAIEAGVDLEQYLASDGVSKKQKMAILKRLDIDLPYDFFDSAMWKDVPERRLSIAIEQYVASIKKKMRESPLKELVGTYETAILSSKLIEEFLKEKKMGLKEGDLKYAYYVDKDGTERKMKVGKLLRDKPELVKMHSSLLQSGVPDRDVEIVISIDPEDIAGKGMNLEKGTCESIGGMYGYGATCGWCDDIKANNLIAYIKRKKDEGKWLGRCMIRWCIREDSNKPDAVLELYYGKPRYRDMLVNNLVHILREKGFSALCGDISCVTPYTYTGYVDIGEYDRSTDTIEYKVGHRNKKK